MNSKNKLTWSVADVNQTKAQVREHLLELFPEENSSKRLSYIVKQLTFEYDEHKTNFLEKVIYCITALYHHARFGGLKKEQINKIENLTLDLLKYLKIKPITSKLSFLYGELFLIRSQIDRQKGEHWKSAWQQQLAHYFAGDNDIGSKGVDHLSLAIRLLRLGRVYYAQNYYVKASESEQISLRNKVRSFLGLARCNRYLANIEESQVILKKLRNMEQQLNESELNEVQWEELCWKVLQEQNPLELIKATKLKSTHYSAEYILETFLWVYAWPEKRYISKMPSIKYLRQKPELGLKEHKFLLECVETLINSYDVEISLPVRLKNLSDLLIRGNEFLSIEQHLLFLLAVIRFLIRSKLTQMAEFCAIEYSKSIQFKNQIVPDPLGIGKDVLTRFGL